MTIENLVNYDVGVFLVVDLINGLIDPRSGFQRQ